MDDTLAVLAENPASPGDTILVIQVKLQLLTNQLNRSCCTWPFGNSQYTSKPHEIPACYLDAFLAQFKKIRSEVPPELASNGTDSVCRTCCGTVEG